MTPGTVAITRLILSDLRNYHALRLDLEPTSVVLVGRNGAGKTNVLEAISMLSPGRGLRGAPFEALVRRGAEGGWAVSARLLDIDGERALGTGYRPGSDTGRRVRIDGATAPRSDAMLDLVRVLWLTPAMDGLFSGPAGDRRRFLDRLTLALDPLHGRRVADFERLMRSRNRVLAEDGERGLLDALEVQLAETGVAVSLARRETVAHAQAQIAADAMENGDAPFPRADIALEGEFEAETSVMDALDAEDFYAQRLRQGRPRDRAAGRTLDGPHRSDLAVSFAEKQMPAALSSTGEQKALLIGLMLAHTHLVAALSGRAPILLLDEIAAHLDEGRRAALFQRLEALSLQAWMTGTDAALFAAAGEAVQRFVVADGTLSSSGA